VTEGTSNATFCSDEVWLYRLATSLMSLLNTQNVLSATGEINFLI
jgi:hypothetical protein